MVWWNLYVVMFMIALVSALVLTPLFRKIAVMTGFYDCPEIQRHKKHASPIPLLGGAAICISWLLTIIIGITASKSVRDNYLDGMVITNLPGISKVTPELIFICAGALLATLLGLYDDRYNMSAKAKLGGQIAIAVIAATWGGVKITFFIGNPAISWCATVFWIVLVMNAVNFFDNMDGLAIGVASIAFGFFTLVAAANSQYFVAAFGAATAGAACGFWFYNHSPATIFMGDSGSHFLGYNMAVLGVLATYYNPVSAATRFPILIPFFILAIPLFDLAAVVIIRIRNGKPVYIGDHNHISHRFVKMGMRKEQAVMMVHLLALSVGLSVLPLLWGDEKTTIVSLLQACTILLMITLLQNIRVQR